MAHNKSPSSIRAYPIDKVRRLLNRLSYIYGVDLEELNNNYFYINSKGKIQMSTVKVDEMNLDRVTGVGIYFGTMHDGERFRPSFEGSRIINPKQNFIVLNESGLKTYISGENLFKDEVKHVENVDDCPFFIVKFEDDCLGSVSFKDNIFTNYIPKGRKLDFNKLF